MNTTGGKDSITLLHGGNYICWRTKVKAILIGDDLWGIVNVPKPGAPTTAWQKQNNKAMALMTLSIEDSQLLHIANCDTGFKMWEKLQKQFARSSFGSQLYLRRKLYGIRFTSRSMQNHINSVLEVVELLKGAGTEITTGELVAVLLCSLPESYSGLVTALEGRDEADLTVEYLTGKVLDEYQRRTEGSSVGDDSALAMRTSAGQAARMRRHPAAGKKLECFYCHKMGHFKSECKKRLRDLRQMNDHGAVAKVMSGDERSGPGSDRKSPQRCTAFTTCERAQIAKANGGWLIDSECTTLMTNDRSFFTEMKETVGEVLLATKEMTPAKGIGDGRVRCRLPNGNIEDITLRDVLYVPELGGGLMSVSKITKNGYRVIFENEGCRVKQRSDGAVVVTARLEGNLFLINSVRTVESVHSAVDTKASLEQWHRRFGHRDPNAIKKLLTDGLVHGLILEGPQCDPGNH
ncbi:zinc knuckle [Trichuris suis]|nr:zinc knuckle [Trichuris suis]